MRFFFSISLLLAPSLTPVKGIVSVVTCPDIGVEVPDDCKLRCGGANDFPVNYTFRYGSREEYSRCDCKDPSEKICPFYFTDTPTCVGQVTDEASCTNACQTEYGQDYNKTRYGPPYYYISPIECRCVLDLGTNVLSERNLKVQCGDRRPVIDCDNNNITAFTCYDACSDAIGGIGYVNSVFFIAPTNYRACSCNEELLCFSDKPLVGPTPPTPAPTPSPPPVGACPDTMNSINDCLEACVANDLGTEDIFFDLIDNNGRISRECQCGRTLLCTDWGNRPPTSSAVHSTWSSLFCLILVVEMVAITVFL